MTTPPNARRVAGPGRAQDDTSARPRERKLPTEAFIADAYRHYHHSVLRRALAILGNEADAKDVAQETFLGLIEAPDQFAGRSALSTWLYRVVTNKCLMRLRTTRTRQRLLDERAQWSQRSHDGHAQSLADARIILGLLPPELARLVVFHSVDGMTQREIGELIGCSRRQVGKQIARAQQLVAQLENDQRGATT